MDVHSGLVLMEDLACPWWYSSFGFFVKPIRYLFDYIILGLVLYRHRHSFPLCIALFLVEENLENILDLTVCIDATGCV